MVTYTNFYETVKEADMRLRYTIVMYEGEPYYVLAIGGHHDDGIFRIYLDKMGDPEGLTHQRMPVPFNDGLGVDGAAKNLDAWLKIHPDKGVIRKMMNSPGFNKFRPFPLGMVNHFGTVCYAERRPVRHTQQGLTDSMIRQVVLTINPKMPKMSGGLCTTSYPLYETIMNRYPEPEECVKQLMAQDNGNTGAAFHRQFAFMKGPIDVIFLAYKEDIVGVLPEGNLSRVKLAPTFKHTKEVVQDLHIFNTVEV